MSDDMDRNILEMPENLITGLSLYQYRNRALSVLAERDALRAENERLRNFARRVMEAWPHGDVDGWELQDAAIEFGLLQETRVHEPCGEQCQCAEYFSSDEWDSGVTCYHPTPLLTGEGER